MKIKAFFTVSFCRIYGDIAKVVLSENGCIGAQSCHSKFNSHSDSKSIVLLRNFSNNVT